MTMTSTNPVDAAVVWQGEETHKRAEFEAWVRTKPGGTDAALSRRDFPDSNRLGQYLNPQVEFAWQALCAFRLQFAPAEDPIALRACLSACDRVIEQGGIFEGIDFHALKKGIERGLATTATTEAGAVPARGEMPVAPDACPITGRKFWGNMEHPIRGMVALYGGPYDSYCIPELCEDGELRSEHYDQDAGEWEEGGVPAGWFFAEPPTFSTQSPGAARNEWKEAVIDALASWPGMDFAQDVPPKTIVEAILKLERHAVVELAAPSSAAAVAWPKGRDVGRIADMSPTASMRVGLDSDNDVYVSVCDENSSGSVEFCTPGAGGGKSSKTRLALIALMVAMEADNAEDPNRDWWQRRAAPRDEAKGNA